MSGHDDKENIREDAEAISGSSEDRGHSLSNDVHPETGKSEEGGKIEEAQVSSLPENRYQQLGWVLRRHFFSLVIVSAYTFLFSLPLVAWILFCTSAAFLSEYPNLYSTLLIYGGVALLLPIMALGFAGSAYFLKKLTWNQGADVRADFLSGVRKNGRSYALIGFLIGLLYLLLHLLISFIDASGEAINPYVASLSIGVGYGFFLLLCSIFCVQGSLLMTYEGGFVSHFLVALKIGLVNLYKGIWVYLLAFVPFIVFEFASGLTVALIVCALCAVFYFGFAALLSVLYCNSLFDLAFNRRLYKEAYRRGLLGQGDVNYDPKGK